MLAIRLPPALEKRLERLAEKTGRSKNFYATRAIIEYIEDLEDVYLAQSRWKELEAGRGRTTSHKEVMDRYTR